MQATADGKRTLRGPRAAEAGSAPSGWRVGFWGVGSCGPCGNHGGPAFGGAPVRKPTGSCSGKAASPVLATRGEAAEPRFEPL